MTLRAIAPPTLHCELVTRWPFPSTEGALMLKLKGGLGGLLWVVGAGFDNY